jgi:hypothetical protein
VVVRLLIDCKARVDATIQVRAQSLQLCSTPPEFSILDILLARLPTPRHTILIVLCSSFSSVYPAPATYAGHGWLDHDG